MKYFKLLLICAAILSMSVWFACDYPDPVEPTEEVPLQFSFASTPGATANIVEGATMTFQWSAVGGTGGIVYDYTFTDMTDDMVLYSVTGEAVTSLTVQNLVDGHQYKLETMATDNEGNTDDDSFSFQANVASTAQTPSVAITSPLSWHKYATGSRVLFEWTPSDPTGTKIESRFKLTGMSAYSDWESRTSWGSTPLTNGSYTFDLEIRNEGGLTATASVTFTVKTADILLVDERTQPNDNHADGGSESLGGDGEFLMDNFYDKVFKGYAYTWFDIHDMGAYPDATNLATADLVVWIGSDHNAGFGWDWGFYYDYYHSDGYMDPSQSSSGALGPIKEYTSWMDNGGHFWFMSENALDNWSYRGYVVDYMEIDSTATPPTETLYPSYWKKYFKIERDYLAKRVTHPDSTVTKTRGEESSNSTLGWDELRVAMSVDPTKTPNMTIDVGKTYNAVFEINHATYYTPMTGAEIVYYMENPSGVYTDRGVCVGTSDGSGGYQNIFMGFPLYYMAPNLARECTIYLMGKMGF